MPKKRSSLAKRRARARYMVIGVVGIAIVAVLILLWFGARRPEVTITAIEVSGTHFAERSEVERAIWEHLEGSHFWLIPYKNALLFPKGKIEKGLKESFAPVHILSVDRSNLTSLVVAIEEREPVARWCHSSNGGTCLLLDQTGVLFAEATHLHVSLAYSSNSNLEVGDVFLDGDFHELHSFLLQLRDIIHRVPAAVHIDEHDDVYVALSDGGEIRFVRGDEKAELLDSITSVFKQRFENGERFEYVDFRFGNKVYVSPIDE